MGYRTTKSKTKAKSNKTNNYTDFYYHLFRNILLVSIPLLLISAIILSLPHSSAYSSSTDSVALTLPTACTISASVVMPHNATLVGGQVEGDIGNTKINAYCNDRNGYFIYAIGNGSNIDGETDLVFNNGRNSSYNIHTGVYNSGNTNSSWAMKLSSNNGTYAPTITNGYDNYNIIPNTDTVVAFRTSGTSMDPNTDLTGSYFNTTYQIYANSIQPTGSYLGKVKYTMTHPYDTTQLTTIEKAFDIVGIDKITIPGIGSYYAMQDMSDRICSLANAYGAEEQLIDIRDNKVYYVSKLPDGHCWMTQNLDIAGGTEITSELSDIPENYNLPTANGFLEGNKLPASSRTGFNNNTQAYVYNTNNSTSNCSTPGCYSYYSWTAATAGSGIDISSANIDAPYSICPKNWHLPSSGNRQPYADYSDFYNLAISYGMDINTVSQDTPNFYNQAGPNTTPSFLLSGYYNSSQLLDIGKYGYYWSATTASREHAGGLYFSEQRVETTSVGRRMLGASIRCVAK